MEPDINLDNLIFTLQRIREEHGNMPVLVTDRGEETYITKSMINVSQIGKKVVLRLYGPADNGNAIDYSIFEETNMEECNRNIRQLATQFRVNAIEQDESPDAHTNIMTNCSGYSEGFDTLTRIHRDAGFL